MQSLGVSPASFSSKFSLSVFCLFVLRQQVKLEHQVESLRNELHYCSSHREKNSSVEYGLFLEEVSGKCVR